MYHSQARTTVSKCRICGESARYSYYGAIVCQSCKMFFKRNAETRQGVLKCSFRNDCQISTNNRHVCPSCRLTKCFRSGMRIEMIRSSRQRKNRQRRQKPSLDDCKSLASMDFLGMCHSSASEKRSPLNFLQKNHLTLNTDQWNLLSSLVHCFDEYGGYALSRHFLQKQNALPIKLRFKFSPVRDFLTSLETKIELVFGSQQHFLSLPSHDRQALLRTTAQHTSTLGALFTIRQHRFFDHPAFYNATEIIFGPRAVAFAKRLVSQLDPDDTLIKLIMAVLFFSTTNYTMYSKLHSSPCTNMKAILPIQNLYIELTWRYAVYKYGYEDAVVRFLHLIECLLLANSAIVHARESQQFVDIINIVIKQAEQGLYL